MKLSVQNNLTLSNITGKAVSYTHLLTVSEADGEVCLKVNKDKGREAYELLKMLYAWKEQADKDVYKRQGYAY